LLADLVDAAPQETFNVDDRGTRVIVGIITASLSAIFIISLVDFFMCL